MRYLRVFGFDSSRRLFAVILTRERARASGSGAECADLQGFSVRAEGWLGAGRSDLEGLEGAGQSGGGLGTGAGSEIAGEGQGCQGRAGHGWSTGGTGWARTKCRRHRPMARVLLIVSSKAWCSASVGHAIVGFSRGFGSSNRACPVP